MTAITSAARHGVLIKGGEHVEKLGSACAFAFDKTGSLTEGRLAVTDVVANDGVSARDLLRTAAAVEHRSEHPLAKAIVAHAAGLEIDFDLVRTADFQSRPGYGVIARVDGLLVRVGKPEMFEDFALPPPLAELQAQGKTVAVVAVNGSVWGLIALADRVRPQAAPAIAGLRKLGIHETVMLTGDHERVARQIADQLGIAEVRAGLLPEDKVNAIVEYRREHEGVAMLGDGVNDAPALAAADVGIVMGAAGSPASVETADVALMGDDLGLLPYALRVGQRARRTLRFNIGLALALKLSLAVGAVLGTVSLLGAVLVGDLGASLAVTANAMRIARLKI
jgi:Cd2+/Zn2+-exporting ATPase